MIEAVIFDMDGLMVDNEHLQHRSYEQVLKEYGVNPVSDGKLIQEIGVNSLDNWKRLKQRYSIEEGVEVLYAKKVKAYKKLLEEGVEPMPGLVMLLEDLSQHDAKLAIASSAAPHVIDIITKKLGVTQHFPAIISGEHVQRGKPEPDIFLKAAEVLGVKPALCVVLEDAPSGVAAGKAAGMKVVLIPNRYIKRDLFGKADLAVDSLGQLSWEVLSAL